MHHQPAAVDMGCNPAPTGMARPGRERVGELESTGSRLCIKFCAGCVAKRVGAKSNVGEGTDVLVGKLGKATTRGGRDLERRERHNLDQGVCGSRRRG
jgi:hypothetical protein